MTRLASYEPTGYEEARADPHEKLVAEWLLLGRDYGAKEVPLQGHSPDICFYAPGLVYLDVKVPHGPNLAISADEFEEQEAKWLPLAYAWKEGDRWCYANHQMLRDRMIGGRRPATPNGSKTDWYLFKR